MTWILPTPTPWQQGVLGVARQGWQCPVCHAVYSPDCMCCWNCRGTVVQTTITTGTQPVAAEPTKEGGEP